MDFVNLNTFVDLYTFGDFTFEVDTKLNDIHKWETVEEIAYEKIYHYLKARGYSDTTYHITDRPGVIAFCVPASSIEGETLVKELAEIYPNYEVESIRLDFIV